MEKIPVANQSIVLREEFDDWALLFDPETGNVFGINPVSVFIWKSLDGQHSLEEIFERLKSTCEDVPEGAKEDVAGFIDELVQKGLAGYEG
jgi:SynChlorMet cassette protein ScmD